MGCTLVGKIWLGDVKWDGEYWLDLHTQPSTCEKQLPSWEPTLW